MTKPELLREIGIHLKKVVDIYNQLAKNPEAFTPGEIDIMVNNAAKIIEFAAVVKHQPASLVNSDEQIRLRDLEDKLRVINEQIKNKDAEIDRLIRHTKELEKKVEENKHLADVLNVNIPEVTDKIDSNSTLAKNDLLNESLTKFVPEAEVIEKVEPVEKVLVADKVEIQPTSFMIAEEKIADNKKTEPPKSISEQYESATEDKNKKSLINSLNESIIDGSKENVVDKMMHSKVGDLKKAIPLHEKFHYTNELFGKNNDHYSQFIDAMNTKQTWTEAEALLAQAASMYNWDPENKTALQFIALIQRRFN